MAKKADKKEHPVRKLVTLFIVTALIYGWVSFGIVELHWDEVQSFASSKWSELTGHQSDEASDSATPNESASPEESESATPEISPEAKPETEQNAESADQEEASQEKASQEKVPSDESAKKEEPKKADPVSFFPKFALDLAGGTEIILTPQLENGQSVDQNALDQAISVIRQRIDASGVAEAEINQQGNSNIVVGIPGEKPSDETIKLISNAAKMNFRPVITSGTPTSTFYMSALQTESAVNSITSEGLETGEDGQPTQEAIQKALAEANSKDAQSFQSKISSDTASGTSKFADVPQDKISEFDALDCSNEDNRKGGSNDKPTDYIATCSQDGSAKYMLAPVSVPGDGIAKANSGLKPLQNGKYSNEWIVQLEFKPEADDQFIATAEQIKVLESPRNQFAICLDGLVISSPQIQKDTTFQKGSGVEISSGQATDASNGGQEWANTLANQLSFGALPMSFNVDSTEQVSATLGSESLEKGLLAGLIGLLLVVLYSLVQYRALGLITIGSLAIASALTYGSVLLLSWQMGYRLSLPGIIGFIVSIGITADSFIVYFERIRDELRDGRALDYAVSRGWKRALRTITASDFVNVLAAFILYFLAVGGVRGFAFTLGLTTVIDFIVVCMFTHPVVSLLARRRFFWAGHPASGLSAFSLGTKSAEKYTKLTREEKKAQKSADKEKKAALKEQKKALKLTSKNAKIAKRDAKKTARIHAKQYDVEMRTRQKLLKSGMTEEEVFDAIPLGSGASSSKIDLSAKDPKKLTIAERRALEAQKADSKEHSKKNEESEKKVTATSKEPSKSSAKSSAKKTTKTPAKKPVKSSATKSTKKVTKDSK